MTQDPAPTPTSSSTLSRPVLVFDGDCGFCTSSVNWVARRFRQPADIEPWQRLDLDALGLSARDVERFAWWIEPAGDAEDGEGGDLRRWRGHRGIGRALRHCKGMWPLVGILLQAPPPISWLWAAGYRLVAHFRGYLPGGTPACKLPPSSREDAP